jgi:hypothetical protein
VRVRPCDTGGKVTALTAVRSWSTRAVPRKFVRPLGAIMSS